jgi:hypothetical protein
MVLGCSLVALPAMVNANNNGEGPVSATVQIDCAEGQSITKVLQHNPAKQLIIEISGICEEEVFIDRPDVTLRGASIPPYPWGQQDPPPQPEPLDGIRHPDNSGNTLQISGVNGTKFRIGVENLALIGGTYGLAVNYAFVSLGNVRMVENTRGGAVIAMGGNVNLSDAILHGNFRSLLANGANWVNCNRCVIETGHGRGRAVVADNTGMVALQNTEVRGNIALQAFNSRINAENSNIESMPYFGSSGPPGSGWALVAGDGSHIDINFSHLFGPIQGFDKSAIRLQQIAHDAPPNEFRNASRFSGDSLLEVTGDWRDPENPMVYRGLLEFRSFSNGVLRNHSIVEGDMICEEGSNAWCDGTSGVAGFTNCELCMPPPEPEGCPCFGYDLAAHAVHGLKSGTGENVCERENQSDNTPIYRFISWEPEPGVGGTALNARFDQGFCEFTDWEGSGDPGNPNYIRHDGPPEEIEACLGIMDEAVRNENAINEGYCLRLPTDP